VRPTQAKELLRRRLAGNEPAVRPLELRRRHDVGDETGRGRIEQRLPHASTKITSHTTGSAPPPIATVIARIATITARSASTPTMTRRRS
jgi:hypothetical protein